MSENIEVELLNSWEETYKKGQLSFWLFLALSESPKYVNNIKSFIEESSSHTISCEEQSLYRTLRKFHHLGMVSYLTRKGNKGPERKYYQLTELGENVFRKFKERNIHILFNDNLKSLIFKS